MKNTPFLKPAPDKDKMLPAPTVETSFNPFEVLPPIDSDIEVSYDKGETWDDFTGYMENRHCMMAGIAGGFGYFPDAGWGTTGNCGTDRGLICDPPDLWRFKS